MAACGISLKNLSFFIAVFVQVSNLTVAEQRHYETVSGLVCDACQPGTHLLADCTETTPTRCEPCVPQLTFSTQYNAAPYCQPCSIGCHGYAEEQVANCTVTSDRVCGCKEGYYRWQHWGNCQRHTPCRLGFGVKQLGSRENNTQCEKCRHGYYSDHVSLTQKCRKHTDCSALGLVEMRAGSRFSDVQCGPCPTDGNITDHTAATSGVTVDPGVEGQTTTFGFDLGTVRTNITNFTIDSVLESPESLHGTMGGVGVGAGLVIIGLLFAAYCWCRKNKTDGKERFPQSSEEKHPPCSEDSGDQEPAEVHHRKRTNGDKKKEKPKLRFQLPNEMDPVLNNNNNGEVSITIPPTPPPQTKSEVLHGQERGTLRKRSSNTSLEEIKGNLMRDVFAHLSRNLGHKWKMFMRKLKNGLSDADLEVLEADIPNNMVERAYQAMVKWFRRNPFEDLSTLVTALEDPVVGKTDLADYIRDKYRTSGFLSIEADALPVCQPQPSS